MSTKEPTAPVSHVRLAEHTATAFFFQAPHTITVDPRLGLIIGELADPDVFLVGPAVGVASAPSFSFDARRNTGDPYLAGELSLQAEGDTVTYFMGAETAVRQRISDPGNVPSGVLGAVVSAEGSEGVPRYDRDRYAFVVFERLSEVQQVSAETVTVDGERWWRFALLRTGCETATVDGEAVTAYCARPAGVFVVMKARLAPARPVSEVAGALFNVLGDTPEMGRLLRAVGDVLLLAGRVQGCARPVPLDEWVRASERLAAAVEGAAPTPTE